MLCECGILCASSLFTCSKLAAQADWSSSHTSWWIKFTGARKNSACMDQEFHEIAASPGGPLCLGWHEKTDLFSERESKSKALGFHVCLSLSLGMYWFRDDWQNNRELFITLLGILLKQKSSHSVIPDSMWNQIRYQVCKSVWNNNNNNNMYVCMFVFIYLFIYKLSSILTRE